MKLLIKTIWMLSLLVAWSVNAAVKCPETKIQSIYQTEEKIFIQLEGQSWHVLAMKSDNDAQKKMARAMNKRDQSRI